MYSQRVFIFLLQFVTIHAFAQPNTFLKIYSGYPPYEIANSVIETYDSGFIAVFPGQNGSSNLLIKTDTLGNIVLTNSYCGYIGTSLIKTVDSNYIYLSRPVGPCTPGGWSDFMVYKINSNLDTLWLKKFGTINDEVGSCIRQLKDGGFALVGRTNGSDNFYKLDSAGNVIWHHWVPMNTVMSVIQDSENNFVLCGYTDGIPDSWTIVKTDSSGSNILWSKYYGTTGGNLSEMFYDVVQLPDSNYLVCGQSPQFIMKINENTGDSVWCNSIPGVIVSMDTAIDGKFIACGDYRLRLLNDSGIIVWTKTFSNLNFEWVKSTSDEGFIAAGYYYQGGQEWPMLLKTDSLGNFTTDMEELNINVLNYSLYPNPLTTQSRLEFGNVKHERFEFALHDVMGRQLENSETTGDNFIINKGSKLPGLYLFKLMNTSTGEISNGKIVIR